MSYCLCKRKEKGKMIGCDGCEDWFHLDCVGLTEKQVSLFPDKWFCSTCQPLLQKEAIKEVLFSEEAKEFMERLIAVKLNAIEALNQKNIKPSEQVIEIDVHKQCELQMKTLKEEYEGKVEKMIQDYNNNENKTKEEIQEVYDKKLIELKEDYESKIKMQDEEKIKNEVLCEQKLEEMKADHEKKLQEISEQYVSQIQSLEEEIKQLKRRIANKRKLSLSQQ